MPLSCAWGSSSYSDTDGGNCVEARQSGGHVQVRDSKDLGGPVLTFSAASWHSFITTIKASFNPRSGS
jgi:hypothetical protein